MNKLETALRKVPGYESESEVAARRFAEHAAHEGLVDVAYTTIDSPVGTVLVAATHRGLVRIAFGDFLDDGNVVEELSDRISPRVLEVPVLLRRRPAGARRVLRGPPHQLRPAARLAADTWLQPPGAEADSSDPLRRGLDLSAGGGRGRQPARIPRGRQRARREPDPDRRSMPPGARIPAAAWAATAAGSSARSSCCGSRAPSSFGSERR